MSKSRNVIVIGGGLAGLSSAAHLAERGVQVDLYEANPYLGGRTASWDDGGMWVESGLHRYLGFYSEMPALLKKAGIDLDKLFYWEDEIIIRLRGGTQGVLGLAPLFKPLSTFKGIWDNNQIFTGSDKRQIVRFFMRGIFDCLFRRSHLDSLTIEEYAGSHDISEKIIVRLITPLSAGLFFLPPSRYSAFVFFALFVPYMHRSYRTRVGAFTGGMTQVMANPIGEYLRGKGGRIHLASPVERLITAGGQVTGVVVDGEEKNADAVVLAASLFPAQQIIRSSNLNNRWFDPLLSMQTMPSVTIQIELNSRAMEKDRTTFAPETC